MMAAVCQRWRPGGHQVWRSPGDGLFNPARYGVAAVSDAAAKAFIETWHYSRSYVAAVHRYGLFDLTGDRPVLAGVAVLSSPANVLALTGVFPGLVPYAESLELGRFVLADEVAFNGSARSPGFWGRCSAWLPRRGSRAWCRSATRWRVPPRMAPWLSRGTSGSSTRQRTPPTSA